MAEKIVELEIPILLPDVMDNEDRCLDRLESAMGIPKGIDQAHIHRESVPARLCVHYNPDLISIEEIGRISRRTGASISSRFRHATLPISGMDCSDCALVIEHSLSRLDGVLVASVSYAAEAMTVEYDTYRTSRRKIETHITRLGYAIPAGRVQSWSRDNRQLLLSLATGLFLVLAWIIDRALGLPLLAKGALYVPAFILGGYFPVRHTLMALRQRRLDTDLLMVLAALGAAILGDFAEGAFLLFLFSLGHALEEKALQRTKDAIRGLTELTPRTAIVARDSGEVEISTEQIKIGERVFIRPGARLPIDGIVIEGKSAIDQSPITGESIPVDKIPGSEVYAGSINGQGLLQVKATRLARDTTMARVIQAVENAQTTKSHTQQLMDRFIQWFVPAILIIDLLLIVAPPLFGIPFSLSFLRAMTVLVAASPCALALGSPAAILSGLAQAARNGVLVKGGVHLENMGQVQAIAFDKTGTITLGVPEVTNIIPFDPNFSQEGILALASAIESYSGHPLARAIQRAAQERQLSQVLVREVTEIPGYGIEASIDGSRYLVGNNKLIDETGIVPWQKEEIFKLEALGKTVICLIKNGVPIGIIAIGDTLRPGIRDVFTRLKQIGVKKIIMLSGDNERAARFIASQIGIGEQNLNPAGDAVYADLSPLDKQTTIRSLIEQYHSVAMVGDGINEAPALASATSGIAVGGAKTDVALETADIVLLSADLTRLPFIIALGRHVRAIVWQNLAIASFFIIALTILTLTGLSGISAAVLLHEGSTLLVVLNGLRLLSFKAS